MSDVDTKDLDRLLQQAFDTASKLYRERGSQRRVGWGKRPALVSVDLAQVSLDNAALKVVDGQQVM